MPPYTNLLNHLSHEKFYFKTEDVERVMATAERLGLSFDDFVRAAIFTMTERRFRELYAEKMLERD